MNLKKMYTEYKTAPRPKWKLTCTSGSTILIVSFQQFPQIVIFLTKGDSFEKLDISHRIEMELVSISLFFFLIFSLQRNVKRTFQAK